MCKVSDKLKLCSCKIENVESLKHYWILNRPEDKDQFTIGLILPPANIGEQIEKFNVNRLRKQLNNGDCFDVTLIHQENDILELHFTCKPKNDTDSGNYLVYAFVYKNGKWKKTSHDPFGNNMNSLQTGRILRPFNN